MGVSGLLPLLKSIQRPTELKKFYGETLGVDAYGWLHRAAYCCALELGQGKPTNKYIHAALHRVKMLRHFGVKPYMVFDGDFLPSKATTEESRAKSRAEKKKFATELLKAGKPSEATQEFQKCIDITPEMASNLIHRLKKLGISYVVAPYEADAQLVYLERQGLISGIISDDSDLLVFGAKRLLTKLDNHGNCIEINRRDFGACREISLVGWTDADFRRMAIMSGCDYLRGLPKVGLKTAHRMLRKCKTPERVVRMLQFEGTSISENYLAQFYEAERTFLHQWVFCPTKLELVHLSELDGSQTVEEMPYLGAHVERELARSIASGDVNPITKEPIVIPTTPSKRRHSQTVATLTSQPPAKPISSYFGRHSRIPMGEMDANCFSVDPQRVAQITDGGLVPRVFPLPRPYLDESSQDRRPGAPRRTNSMPTRTSPLLQRRRSEPLENMLSRVAGGSANTQSVSDKVDPSAATPRVEPPVRPKKKARLCGEANEDGSPKNSKFFPAKSPRRVKSPRRAKSDAYLLSDDSIEEALRDLPDFDGWKLASKGSKSIAIFDDTAQEKKMRDTPTARASQVRQMQSENKCIDASIESSMPRPKSVKSSAQPLRTPARLGLNRFCYSTRPTETPGSSASHRSLVFSAASTPSTAPSTARSRLTPLQRLGARATDVSSPRPLKPRPMLNDGFGKTLPVNPAFVPLPEVDVAEVVALNGSCGSEDRLVVPDSDEEGEDEVELPPLKLDLSRYAFA